MALFAGLLLSPRTSEAGCGDYVWIRGRPAPMVHSMPDLTPGPLTLDPPTRPDGSSNDGTSHGSPGRPCHGPGCSDGSFPPRAPSPGIVVSIDQWAMTASGALPNLVSCSNVRVDRFDFVEDGCRLSILRPPR